MRASFIVTLKSRVLTRGDGRTTSVQRCSHPHTQQSVITASRIKYLIFSQPTTRAPRPVPNTTLQRTRNPYVSYVRQTPPKQGLPRPILCHSLPLRLQPIRGGRIGIPVRICWYIGQRWPGRVGSGVVITRWRPLHGRLPEGTAVTQGAPGATRCTDTTRVIKSRVDHVASPGSRGSPYGRSHGGEAATVGCLDLAAARGNMLAVPGHGL